MTVDLDAKIKEFVKANKGQPHQNYKFYTFIKKPIPEGHKLYGAYVTGGTWDGMRDELYIHEIIATSPQEAKKAALKEARDGSLSTRFRVNVWEKRNVIDLSAVPDEPD